MTSLWNHEYPGIHIEEGTGTHIEPQGHQAFFHRVKSDLDRLMTKPIGKSLIEIISKRCQGVGTKLKDGKVSIRQGIGKLGKESTVMAT